MSDLKPIDAKQDIQTEPPSPRMKDVADRFKALARQQPPSLTARPPYPKLRMENALPTSPTSGTAPAYVVDHKPEPGSPFRVDNGQVRVDLVGVGDKNRWQFYAHSRGGTITPGGTDSSTPISTDSSGLKPRVGVSGAIGFGRPF